jgi:monoterpene epsilon-lactone hydrolase
MSVRAIAIAWMMRRFVKPRMGTGTLEEGRRGFEAMASRTKPPANTIVETFRIGELEADRLTPPGADPARALLYLFGGGYQAGSPLAARALAARIAGATGAWALVPAYRLCPEHPLSASLEDALTAFRWLVQKLGSADRIVVVGESAGGGLALRLLVALRDAGDPLPAAAVVLSPWTDLAMTGASVESNAGSEAIFSHAFLDQTMKNLAGLADFRDPLISPLYADLSGLPPLLIHVSGDEVLRDDSVRFAERARSAGVDVTLKVFRGLWHVFHMQSNLPEARGAVKEIGEFTRKHLAVS